MVKCDHDVTQYLFLPGFQQHCWWIQDERVTVHSAEKPEVSMDSQLCRVVYGQCLSICSVLRDPLTIQTLPAGIHILLKNE